MKKGTAFYEEYVSLKLEVRKTIATAVYVIQRPQFIHNWLSYPTII